MSEAPCPHRLGKYRLVRRLAVGGMAEVYLAVAEGLSGFAKQVVIKRLLPQHVHEQDLLAMFVDEARLLARLRHPNIAEVYDVGQDGDELYIALEFVDGVDLRDLLQAAGGPLPLPETLWIMIALAEGLHCAHELDEEGPDGQRRSLGIVHRDVSPSNVLCARDGTVKLIDFGVAKWAAQMSETRHGTVKGKLHYLSPEQCRSSSVDRRSDVFALGVLLYELSTGRRPFEGATDFDVLAAIIAGRYAPPRHFVPGYPDALDAVVVGALTPDPDSRFPTARAVAGALRGCAHTLGIELSGAALAARVCARSAALRNSAGPPPWHRALAAAAAVDVRAAHERTRTEERTLTEPAPHDRASVGNAAEQPSASPVSASASTPPRRHIRMAWATAAVVLGGVVAALFLRAGPREIGLPPEPQESSLQAPPGAQAGEDRPRSAVRSADTEPPESRGEALAKDAQAEPGASSEPSARTRPRDGRRGARGPDRSRRVRASVHISSPAPALTATSALPPPTTPAPEPLVAPTRPPAPVKIWDPDSPIPP